MLNVPSFSRFLHMSRGANFRAQLLRGGLGSTFIKVTATALSLLVAVTFARSLGPNGYGTYSYVLSLVSLLAIPAQFGLPNLVVRETASAHATKQWALMRGVWRWATLVAGGIAVAIAAVGCGLAWYLSDQFSDSLLLTLLWGILLVPLIAFGNLRGAALRGVRRVVAGQLPEHVLRPALLLGLAGGAATMLPFFKWTAEQVMAVHVVAAALSFAIGMLMLRRLAPAELRNLRDVEYNQGRWVRSIFPLGMIAAMQVITSNADILLLGVFRSAADVGIYKVASQMATFVSFPIAALNLVIAPFISRFYALRDHRRLQLLVTKSALLSLVSAVPIALGAIVFGMAILSKVFGEVFVEGYLPMVILCLGQLAVAACGSLVTLASMTGHERQTALIIGLGLLVNIVLNLCLIPLLGMLGAALATAASIVVWRSVLLFAVRAWLGINASALGK